MRRIAIRSLVHDRGKLIAALTGVAFAAALVLIQTGLYEGFRYNASGPILRAGGDVWVMPRGVPVVERGELMGSAARAVVASHPCVRRVRGLIYAFIDTRKPDGARDSFVLVGYEPGDGAFAPWTLDRGLPHDLHAPLRVAVDAQDLRKFGIVGDPIGARLEVAGEVVRVAAVTRGMRSFTLTPFLFAEIRNARRLLHLADDRAHYWLADLADPGCADDVVRHLRGHRELDAVPAARFAAKTEDHWVIQSGAGGALAFSAVLGLVVGVIIVGQSLYAVTREHLKELATLKAIGASDGEIVTFVLWQAALLAVCGGAAGLCLAVLARAGVTALGLTLILTGRVLAMGLGAVVAMCVLASLGSVSAVLRVEAVEVFK
jgi:putative ABC transport system permease protein